MAIGTRRVVRVVAETFNGNANKEHAATPGDGSHDAQMSAILDVRELLRPQHNEVLCDAFLRKCLAQHKGSTAKAAAVAGGFLRFRRSVSWPFRIAAHDVETALRSGMHMLLPLRRESGKNQAAVPLDSGDTAMDVVAAPAACLVYNVALLQPSHCSIEEYQKMGTFLVEHATDQLAVQQRGVALVVDCKGVELASLMRTMGLADLRRGVLMWRGAFPCRLRRIWVLDAPGSAGAICGALARLLAPRVRERIRFGCRTSDGLSELADDMGAVFELPESLGGSTVLNWNAEVDRYLALEPSVSSKVTEPIRSPKITKCK